MLNFRNAVSASLLMAGLFASSAAAANQAKKSEGPSPSYLRAPPKKEATSPASRKSPDLKGVSIALFLLATLGGVALYARRRHTGSPLLKNHVRLHCLASVSLGPKSKLALISVGREAILVGASEGSVTCLRTYPEHELGTLTTSLEPSAPASTPGYDEAFNELLLMASKDDAKSRRGVKSAATTAGATATARKPAATGQQTSSKAGASPTLPVQEAKEDSGPRITTSEDFPPHLLQLIAETESAAENSEAPKASSPHLRAVSDDSFGESEGQAAELMRRFSELG